MKHHDMDKGLEDGRSSCKICGQVEGYLSQECPGAPVFKITKAGKHLRRDGEEVYLVSVPPLDRRDSPLWRDTNTGMGYYSNGFYTANAEIPSNLDIVAFVDEPVLPATEPPPGIQIGAFSLITEYERRVIAAQILAGIIAYSADDRIDHIMHADALVSNAVVLADKLIAHVRATHK